MFSFSKKSITVPQVVNKNLFQQFWLTSSISIFYASFSISFLVIHFILFLSVLNEFSNFYIHTYEFCFVAFLSVVCWFLFIFNSFKFFLSFFSGRVGCQFICYNEILFITAATAIANKSSSGSKLLSVYYVSSRISVSYTTVL